MKYRLTDLDRDYCARMHAPAPRTLSLSSDSFADLLAVTDRQHGQHHDAAERESEIQARTVARYVALHPAEIAAREGRLQQRLTRMRHSHLQRAHATEQRRYARWALAVLGIMLLAFIFAAHAHAQQSGGGVIFQVQNADGSELFHRAAGWMRLRCSTGVTCTQVDANTFALTAAGGPGGAANWGTIGGTLSSQTDLQTALNAKANTTALPGTGVCTTNQFVTAVTTGVAPTCALLDWSQIQNRPSFATVATTGAYADLLGKPTLGTAATLDSAPTGNAGPAQAVVGNDTRLSDARTPTTHAHGEGDITNLGTDLAAKVPTTRTVNSKALSANIILAAADVSAEAAGTVATHAAVATSVHGIANTANLVLTGDSRLSDARTPTAHNQAETTLTFTDLTTGNATTLLHGFLPKLGGGTTNFLRADGTWAAPAGSSGDVTDVNITTTAPLAGGATCASGVCAFTLDVAHDTATWNAYQLQGVAIDAATPTTNDVLTYNGAQWTHAAPTGGGAPTGAQYWVGAADATLSAEKDLSGWTGIVKNTAGTPTAAIAADFPTLNQNTSGTAANLSGTPALPNGTTATTQSAGDNSTKLATTAYVPLVAPTNYEVASDWSTTSTTFSNITGLGWTVGASATQTFDCFLAVQDASSTVGMVLGFTGPGSPTAVTVRADLLLTTQTAPTTQASTGAAWPTAIPTTACTSSCLASFRLWRISGVIKNGTNAGTVQLQGKVSSGTGKVGAASACWVH